MSSPRQRLPDRDSGGDRLAAQRARRQSRVPCPSRPWTRLRRDRRSNRRSDQQMTVGRIGFAYNPTSDAALELSAKAAGWCQLRGIDQWQAPSGETETLVRELPTTDALVVLGGDGTFLRAARAVSEVDVPLLGINLGKVGFLSKAEAGELEAVLGQIVDGDYRIDERLAIEGEILPRGRSQGNATSRRHFALNDIVIARGSLARVCRLDVEIDD